MKRSINMIILFLFIIKGNNAQKIVSIEKEFPLNWSVEIGNVTYRTNLISTGDHLLIGSNGNNYRDYSIDKNNGLKVIDPEKGKVKRVILGESYGDVDVNGVVVYDNKIYFGNDNDEFVCVDIQGNIQWRLPLSGDVEHEPILINKNENILIVFATETGELRAVDPENGNTIWEHLHPNFKGWRQGDNRVVFKIKTHFRSGGVFFSKPAIADLNRDGVDDLIYSCNYDETRAINGSNGKILWSLQKEDKDKWSKDGSYHDSPIVVGKGSHLRVLVPMQKHNQGKWVKKIAIYNRKGILIKDHHLNSSIGGRGLNSLNVSSEKVIIPFTTALGIYNTKNEQVDFIHGLNLKYTYTGWQNKQIVRDRFAHDPLIANQLIKYNNEECVVVLFQEDYAVEGSQSLVSIIGIESKTIHNRLHLPSGSEFAPHISDVNNDGKLDLLVGCYDGKLYSYNMGIPSRNMLIKEKKYSISVSVENEELDKLNLVNETNEDSGKNAGDIALEQEEIKNNEAENITNKTDLNSKEEGISTANIYLISYASLALLLFVGASIYLFRNKQEEVLVDQS